MTHIYYDHIDELLRDEVCSSYYENLPEIFRSETVLLDLERDKNNVLPQINSITITDVKNGVYHDKMSHSDHMYANRIRFYVKFEFFDQYADNDELSWIIYCNRYLLYKILKHHREKQNSLWSLYNDLKCITRISKIVKEKYGIYKKFSKLTETLNSTLEHGEEFNKISQIEINRLIDWETILKIRDEIELKWRREYETHLRYRSDIKQIYTINLDLILLSMYTLACPNRKELMGLRIIYDENDDDKESDFLLIGDKCKYILNKDKKKHSAITIDLSRKLSKLLRESAQLFPREYVFTNINIMEKPVTSGTVSKRLSNMFSSLGKNIGVASLRYSFVSWLFRTNPSSRYLNDCATKMRTSVYAFSTFYKKLALSVETRRALVKQEPGIYDNPNVGNNYDLTCDIEYAITIDNNDTIRPQFDFSSITYTYNMKHTSQYHKDYYRNPEKRKQIREKQKQYYEANKEKKYIKSILYKLNNDVDFVISIKSETLKKWFITYDMENNEWKTSNI